MIKFMVIKLSLWKDEVQSIKNLLHMYEILHAYSCYIDAREVFEDCNIKIVMISM